MSTSFYTNFDSKVRGWETVEWSRVISIHGVDMLSGHFSVMLMSLWLFSTTTVMLMGALIVLWYVCDCIECSAD